VNEFAAVQSFDFAGCAEGAADVAPAQDAMTTLARMRGENMLERMRSAVEAAGQATYHWIVETDEIVWSANAADVLGCDPAVIRSGRAYAACLDADNVTSRYETVMSSVQIDDGTGVPFEIEYKFRPQSGRDTATVWVEDHGRWYAGSQGRPLEVFGVVRRIDSRQKRDQQLSFVANCDPLTGMMNRGRLTEALGEAIAVAMRDQSSCAFVIAAINNLAVVNEAYGFEVADEVVAAIARRLRAVVRTGDAIARYSGSKFGLILNGCSDAELAIAVERYLSVARDSVIETSHGPVWAMLSIGALVLPAHASDAGTAMARAEEALTEARRLPSDGAVVYRNSRDIAHQRMLNARCATDIVRCLKEDRFKIAFQPIVDAGSGAIVMHETLLRMHDGEGGLVTAGHLIPVAEKLGLVRLIDRAVVQKVVTALYEHPEARLSVNVSATTANDPRWFAEIVDTLSTNRAVVERLTVEITETAVLRDLDETARFVAQIRDLGCGVAIDDFGAGFTSFRNLRNLPVTMIKLDGDFCRDLTHSMENWQFIATFADLARKLGLKTVVEWVETEEDAAIARGLGVDYLQGRLFGDAVLTPPWEATSGPAVSFEIGTGRKSPAADAKGDGGGVEETAPVRDGTPGIEAPPDDDFTSASAEEPFDFARLRAALAALDTGFSDRPADTGVARALAG
jgi:diguanylate cyclase (GGDEF)-like protein